MAEDDAKSGATGTIDDAIAALKAGKVVAIPTDTVYGLAVDPSRPASTAALFALKERPADVDLPVLVAGIEQADALSAPGSFSADASAGQLAQRYWPGPLTIVVRRRSTLDWDLGSSDTTIGLRAPSHEVALRLCSAVGPLATTSANRHGAPPKTTAAEVSAEFRDEVAVIVGGETGGAVPSTVVDATGESLRLLRSGAIDFDELRSFLNREPLVDFPPLGGVEQLVRAAQRGDPVAMDALIRALSPYVGRVCGAIALERGDDAMQETFISVFRNLRALRDPTAVHGWVRRIAVREAVRAAKGGSGTGAGTSATHAGIDGGSEPMAPPVDLDTVLDVRAVLEELSPEHRAVLVLRDLDGLAEVDVATLLGVAEGTVKSRLHRARTSFARRWVP